MTTLLQIDFPYNGPFGAELAAKSESLAHEISEEPGLLWKIWTENKNTNEAGGLYLFESEKHAKKYLEKHLGRMLSNGIYEVRTQFFDINHPLSTLTRAPLR